MSDDDLPLSGIRVLDVSSFIAAPAAAVALGDYGADVIKVEPPGVGDPHRGSWKNATYPQAAVNFPWALDARNKRSLALDLKAPEGRAALERLIATADVMIINFPPPVRERLKLTWADVEPINPRLIYASLTGYGETGPDRDRPGFDVTAFFARSGILDALRYEGQPAGFSLPGQGDRSTAMTLVAAIMMALFRRERTGKGGWVGTSLYANGVWSTGTLAAGALLGAEAPSRPPREKASSALAQQYAARDGRWFLLLAHPEEKHWENVCRGLGLERLLADPRFADRAGRRRHAGVLLGELEALFASEDWAVWERRLTEIGVPFSPIARVADVAADEQALHAGIVVPCESEGVPRTLATPIRLGWTAMRAAGAPPALGEHSDQVLSEAGLDEAEIAALRAKGVVG